MIKIINNKKYFYFIGAIFTLLNLKYTFITGAQHDYAGGLGIWKMVIAGKNPWDLHGIFYGPLWFLFGSLAKFHDLLPKLINFFFWNFTLIIILKKSRKSFFIKIFIFFLFNSPNFWIEIYKFGHFEGVLMFFIILSITFFEKKKYYTSGFLFGIAVCYKLTPLLIALFFIFKPLEKNIYKLKINYNFLISFFIIIFLVYFVTIVIYDFSAISNLIRIGFVKSEHMSFFRFLRGDFSPLEPIYIDIFNKKNVEVISFISYVIIALIFLKIFINFIKKKINLINAILFISLLVPFLYKSGYVQYFTLHFVILFYYFSKIRQTNIEAFFSKYLIFLLQLAFVTYFNFFHAYALHIFTDLGPDPVWGGGDFGKLRINEWAGFLGLFFIVPPLICYYRNSFKI
jgi:hypothetical protein